jgi:MoxR-like ATPase
MDCDSSDSSHRTLPNNTAILVGPHGCGKTSAVYAIANELGFQVTESDLLGSVIDISIIDS